MNNNKLARVDMLRDGTKFEIPSLKQTMKCMRLVSVSDCSSLIEGQKRDFQTDPWKPFRYHISNSVLVLPNNGVEDVQITEKPAPKSNSVEKKEKKGRGRPSKKKPLFRDFVGLNPASFTIRDILNNNDIKDYEAHKAVKSALESQEIVQTNTLKGGGRGKPQKVYKLNN